MTSVLYIISLVVLLGFFFLSNLILIFHSINIFTWKNNLEKYTISVCRKRDDFSLYEKFYIKSCTILGVDNSSIQYSELLHLLISIKFLLIKTCWCKAED